MAYRVEYRPIKKIRRVEKRTVAVPALTVLCFLLFALLVNTAWPAGADVLEKLIFPGDAAVTAAALENLVQELRTGEELPRALETFCQTIVRNAHRSSD